ncbi:hypothetical protein DL96DRAFT_1561914 [Flagelloscypha sp. PMI_526]|nr:hypothetical protein DL96DRAFT_1561914 [Flagelloscypha sp. PMI_526]
MDMMLEAPQHSVARVPRRSHIGEHELHDFRVGYSKGTAIMACRFQNPSTTSCNGADQIHVVWPTECKSGCRTNEPITRQIPGVFLAYRTLRLEDVIAVPYTSVLGEHFRCHWDVPSATYDEAGSLICHVHTTDPSAPSSGVTSIEADTASVRSSKSTGRSSILAFGAKSTSTAATTPQDGPIDVAADMLNLSLGSRTPAGDERIRVVDVTEQVSHHPLIFSFYASAPSRHVEISGADQISAKVSGPTLRVSPASVNGILRGSFYVTVGDSCIIAQTCNKHGQHYRAILEYKEEGWISKARYLVEGVIHTYHQGETAHEKWLKVKDVPKGKIVAVLERCWRGVIKCKNTGRPDPAASAESSPAPSVSYLSVAAPNPALGSGLRSAMSSKANLAADDWQVVRLIEKQEAYESQKLWEKVTSHLLGKRFSEATIGKVAIEQRPRDIAAERKRTGEVDSGVS